MNEKQKKIILLIVSAFWFSQYVYIPYQVTYLQSLGYSSSVIGIVVGAYGFVQIFLRIPIGLMADHEGRHKRIITFGIACAGIASLFRIFIPNSVGYFLANLFSGIGASTWISFMVLYLSYFENSRLQAATGKVLAANNIGIFLGFLISSICFSGFGMKFICGTSVAVAFIAFLFSKFVKDHIVFSRTLSCKELLGTFKYKRLLFFSILALIQQGIQMATVMSFTVKVVKNLGGKGWQIGMTSIVYIVFSVLFAGMSTKQLFMKIGYKYIIPAGMVIQFLYCILVPNMTSIYGVYACQILASMATGFLFTALTSESMKNIPANRNSTAMGIFQAIYAIGMTFMPMMLGYILDLFNFKCAYYFMALFVTVGFISSIVFYIKEKQYGFCKET